MVSASGAPCIWGFLGNLETKNKTTRSNRVVFYIPYFWNRLSRKSQLLVSVGSTVLRLSMRSITISEM